MSSPITKFHLYRINIAKSGNLSYYMNTCDVTKDKKCAWVSKTIRISDKSMVNDEGFWPKLVRITDNLVYLVCGSKEGVNFL